MGFAHREDEISCPLPRRSGSGRRFGRSSSLLRRSLLRGGRFRRRFLRRLLAGLLAGLSIDRFNAAIRSITLVPLAGAASSSVVIVLPLRFCSMSSCSASM
jgi:hypothetical protein